MSTLISELDGAKLVSVDGSTISNAVSVVIPIAGGVVLAQLANGATVVVDSIQRSSGLTAADGSMLFEGDKVRYAPRSMVQGYTVNGRVELHNALWVFSGASEFGGKTEIPLVVVAGILERLP